MREHLRPVFDLLHLKPRADSKSLHSFCHLGVKGQRRVLLHERVCLGEIFIKRHRHACLYRIHILRRIVSALWRDISRIAISRKRISLHGVLNLPYILIVALSLIKDAYDTPAHCRRHLHKSGSRRNNNLHSLLGEHICAAISDDACCVCPCVKHLNIAESVFDFREFEHNRLIQVHPQPTVICVHIRSHHRLARCIGHLHGMDKLIDRRARYARNKCLGICFHRLRGIHDHQRKGVIEGLFQFALGYGDGLICRIGGRAIVRASCKQTQCHEERKKESF